MQMTVSIVYVISDAVITARLDDDDNDDADCRRLRSLSSSSLTQRAAEAAAAALCWFRSAKNLKFKRRNLCMFATTKWWRKMNIYAHTRLVENESGIHCPPPQKKVSFLFLK